MWGLCAPHAAGVAADDARPGAVSVRGGGLDGAGALLMAHERGHEVAQGDAGGRRTSQEPELHDEGVACALRLPLRLGDEGVVGPDGSVVNVGVNP